jgi:hypothetical protein
VTEDAHDSFVNKSGEGADLEIFDNEGDDEEEEDVMSPDYIPSLSPTALSNEKRFASLISTPQKSRTHRTTDIEGEITQAIPSSSPLRSSKISIPTQTPRRGKEEKDIGEGLKSSSPEGQEVDTFDRPLNGSISNTANGFTHESQEALWHSSDDSEEEDFSGIEKDADDVAVVQRAYFEALLSLPGKGLAHAIGTRYGDEEIANGNAIPVDKTVLDNAPLSQDSGPVVDNDFHSAPSISAMANSPPLAGPGADVEPKSRKVRLCLTHFEANNLCFPGCGCSWT